MNDRDRFAAAALTGILTNMEPETPADRDDLAWMAYKQADAMLREREKWPGATTGDTQTAPEAYVDFPTVDPNVVNRVPVKFTNHDAAPAARSDDRECAAHVATGGTSDRDVEPATTAHSSGNDGARPDSHGTGGTQEPFAWYGIAARTDGGSVVSLCMTAEKLGQEIYARDTCDPRKVIPLYRQPQPTLSDAEREAVEHAIELVDATAGKLDAKHYRETVSRLGSMAATLRGLLERLGGEL